MHKLFKNTVFIGKKTFFLPSCHSTNDIASVLLTNKKVNNGTVIYTDYQSKGKGQRGNIWESNSGENILISIILETKFVVPPDFFDLTIITSLAIHDLLTEYLKEDIKIKWPNDLMYRNRKIGGILIENYINQKEIKWSIVGVGLNINQLKFKEKNAISLAMICDQGFGREELINLLLQKLEVRYFQLQRKKIDLLRKEYLNSMYWKGTIHVFETNFKKINGRIIGVEKSGKLKVELENGVQLFNFKEIKYIK